MAVLLLPTGAVWYDQVLKPCLVFDVCPLLDSCAGVLKGFGSDMRPSLGADMDHWLDICI